MSKQALGLSIQTLDNRAVVYQPPTEKLKPALFVVDQDRIWKLELSDSLVSQQRHSSKLPDIKSSDSREANFTFLNDTLKDSVNRQSYEITWDSEIPYVNFKYTIAGVEYFGSFSGFVRTNFIDLLKTLTLELNRVYSDIEVMLKSGSDQGLTLELKSEKMDPLKAQRIKDMNVLRKHVSAADPLVIKKKVQRGFGSK
jgi:hypothetical protein